MTTTSQGNDTRDRDDFDGIDINGPWGGIRIGAGGVRMGAWDDDWGDDDAEVRRIRRHVRRRLDLYRNLAFFVVVAGGFILLDVATGEGASWSLWVAGIWGIILLMQFFGTFVAPAIWGREAEERMVRREVERQRGRMHVVDPPDIPRTD
jgi:hypothetical protein